MPQEQKGTEDKAQGSVSNQDEINPGKPFRGVINLRRTPGVALASIKNKITRVKRFASVVAAKLKSPGEKRHDGMMNFVSYVRGRSSAHRPVAIQRQPSEWRKLDMVLPNGSSVGDSRARPTTAQLFEALPKGQVIPPFAPSDTPFSQRIRKKPAKPGRGLRPKQPDPRARMFSKVIEIDSGKPPAVAEETEPAAREKEDTAIPKDHSERAVGRKPEKKAGTIRKDRRVIQREPEKRPISRPVEQPTDKEERLDDVKETPIVRREPSTEKDLQPARDEKPKTSDIFKPIDQPPTPPKLPRREKAAPPGVEKKEEPVQPAVDRKPPVSDQISEPPGEKVVRRAPDDRPPPKVVSETTPREPGRVEVRPVPPVSSDAGSPDTGVEVPVFRPILDKPLIKPPGRMTIMKAPMRILQRSPAPEVVRRKIAPQGRLDQPFPAPPASPSTTRADEATFAPSAEVIPPLESRPRDVRRPARREPSHPSKQPVLPRQYIMPMSRITVRKQPETERDSTEAVPLVSRRRTVGIKPGSQDFFIRRRIGKRIQRKVQFLPQLLPQQKRDVRSISEKIGRPIVQRQVMRESPVDREAIQAASLVSPAAVGRVAGRGRRAEYGSGQTVRRMPEEPTRAGPPPSPARDMPVVRPPKQPGIKETIQRAIDPEEASLETQGGGDQPPDESFEWAPEESPGPSMPDLPTLARQVFPLIRRLLAQEKERSLGKQF